MFIGRALRVLVLGTLASVVGCSSGNPPAEEDLAQVSVALKIIPADVGCFALKANPAGAAQPLELDVTVVAGKAAAFTMGGIPQGQVTFSAQAFAGSCPVAASASPTWVSQPTTITVISGVTTPLSVAMTRPGQVAVSVDFATSCPTGQVACTQPDGSTGACQTTSAFQKDPKNCGACGVVCAPGQSCAQGSCTPANGCPSGSFACLKATGALGPCMPTSDLQTDNSNCGSCGKVCGGLSSCVNGACALPNNCPTGQISCLKPTGAFGPCMPASNLQTDSSNCGACGTVCGGISTCQSGACALPNNCPTGQIACLKATGAFGPCMPTSNLQTDSSNCGACGTVCGGISTCQNGACALPNNCPTGQIACLKASGAFGPCMPTSNLQTDKSNCGSCGKVCSSAQSCVSGACK